MKTPKFEFGSTVSLQNKTLALDLIYVYFCKKKCLQSLPYKNIPPYCPPFQRKHTKAHHLRVCLKENLHILTLTFTYCQFITYGIQNKQIPIKVSCVNATNLAQVLRIL